MKTKVRSRRQFAIEQLEFRRVLASDYLLEIEGIKGESTDAKHPGAIELASFSWGASSAQTNRPASRMATEEFRFLTDVSKASPLLYSAAAQGKHISKAVLYVRKAGGDQQEYMTVKLTDVLVSSVQSRSLNEEIPKEEVAFTFAKIEQAVRPQNPDGSLGAPEVSSWTLPKHTTKLDPQASLLEQRPSSNQDETDAFLQIDGIKGESTDAKYPDSIEIESFSWGVSQSSSAGGGGGGAGKATFQDLHFVTKISKASPLLARAAATGQHIKQAVLNVRRESSVGDSAFLKIKLTDVLVSSFQSVGSSDAEPLEEITFSFNKITQSFTPQSESGQSSSPVTSDLAAPSAETAGDLLLPKTVVESRASDIFLEIDGIKGESTDAKHKNEIEIDSFSWGLSQRGGGGGGGAAGKVTVQDFHFTSKVSKASPLLMSSVATGKHFPSADLSVRKAGGSQTDYLKYEMEDLLVSSYSTQSLNNEVPTDSFSLNFSKIDFRYATQQPDGSLGSPVSFDWTVPQNATHVPNTVPSPATLESDEQPPTQRAAVDFLLEIDGIKGESTVEDHKGAIELQSFSWGMNQAGHAGGGGGGAGKVSMQDFHFVAPTSLASPQLFSAVAAGGQHIKKATLFVRKAGSHNEFLKFVLTDAEVDSLQVQAIDRTTPTEEFTLNFSKMDVRYETQAANGQTSATEASLNFTKVGNRSAGPSILADTKPQAAAFDYFLKIEGIKGESVDDKHKNHIEVDSFSWGVSQTSGGGGGGGAGKVSMQDFHFVMSSSAATPQLIAALAQGKHIDSARLEVRRAGDNSPPAFLKYELEDLLISSYQIDGTAGNRPEEEIAINFRSLQEEYALRGVDGSTRNTVESASWTQGKKAGDYDQGESILAKTTPKPDGSQYLLKIRGPERSAATEHKEWIELSSFSWGANRTIRNNGRQRAGNLDVGEFQFEADLSLASPALMTAMVTGEDFINAIVQVRAKNQADPYLKIKLTDVLVSSFSLNATSPDDPTNRFRLNAAAVDVAYEAPQQLVDGLSRGAATSDDGSAIESWTAHLLTDSEASDSAQLSPDEESQIDELFQRL